MNPTHLQRAAYVSIRQSSGHQVRYHQEGQRRHIRSGGARPHVGGRGRRDH